jgi:ketosteroid isomerase-like protein
VAEVFKNFHSRVEVANEEIVVSGGATQHFDRRYLEIWRKEGGQWKVSRTMDNTREEVKP